MEECIYRTVRGFFMIRNFFRKLCPSGRTQTEYQIDVDKSHNKFDIQRVTRVRQDGRIDKKYAIWYIGSPRKFQDYATLFENVPPPWLSIRCGEKDMTAEMANYICKGNHIKPQFLESLSSDIWYYMHPRTFEEVEFPSNGILIE